MEGSGSGSLRDVAKCLADKQPGTIKEVTKVLVELTAKLEAFATDMRNVVGGVANSNTEIRSELGAIRDSIGFMNDGFEQFKKDVDGFRRELTTVTAENQRCKRENEQLSKELKEAKREIVELKQYSRNMNLEVKGLPLVANEDLRRSVGQIATCIGTSVTDNDIDVVHRVPSKDKNKPNVIIKFSTRSARDRVLSAARTAKLSTGTLGFEESNPVYINEHLCVENKRLLGRARQLRREKEWKFVWVSQGKILMRKSENSPVLHVTCDSDLDKVR
ncbi:uncharacterized protein LOC142563783 [Dermacentor variabilis]|uniref:uncharacterized protein LOC142563783 n=1 Tax=Dermacentor variabilis TaxID=34621 RepID=UPI003F5C6250